MCNIVKLPHTPHVMHGWLCTLAWFLVYNIDLVVFHSRVTRRHKEEVRQSDRMMMRRRSPARLISRDDLPVQKCEHTLVDHVSSQERANSPLCTPTNCARNVEVCTRESSALLPA
jgi:hypothetical protein